MQRSALTILIAGFMLFCVGGLARTYMNFSLNQGRLIGGQGNRSTEVRYKQLMKDQGAPAWPLIVSVVCIPLGVIVVFGALLWVNHHRVR